MTDKEGPELLQQFQEERKLWQKLVKAQNGILVSYRIHLDSSASATKKLRKLGVLEDPTGPSANASDAAHGDDAWKDVR